MANGYTYGIEENPNFTAKDFALTCARAFGAFIHQRDQPLSELPKAPEMDSYPVQRLERALKEKADWNATSLEDKRAQWEEYTRNLQAQYTEQVQEYKVMSKRYAEMRASVEAWQVPEELDNLKNFMLKQIDESVRWSWDEEPSAPNLQSFEEWLEPREGWLDQSITRALECLAKAQKLHEDRVAYAEMLYEAVKEL